MPCPQSRGRKKRTPKGVRAGDLADFFFNDNEEGSCRNCSICIVYAANTDFGCWQYSHHEGTFNCFSSEEEPSLILPEIEGFTKSRWNTYAKMNDYQANLTCLQSEARLRFVKKNGQIFDPSLSWGIEEGIQNGGLLFAPLNSQEISSENEEKDGSFRLKFDEISSPRLGYIYAQQAQCKSKESKGQESKKNPRKQRKLPLLPCDGMLGSNATLNKCGHCYTDPKEKDMHVNECGACFDQPCCSNKQKNACDQCPDDEKAGICQPEKALKIIQGQVQDLVCNRSFATIELKCLDDDCFPDQMECFLQSFEDSLKSFAVQVEILTASKFKVVFKDVSVGKYHVRCGFNGSNAVGENDGQLMLRSSIQPMLVVNSGLTRVNNVTTKQSTTTQEIEVENILPLSCYLQTVLTPKLLESYLIMSDNSRPRESNFLCFPEIYILKSSMI